MDVLVDEKLIEQARTLGEHKTHTEALAAALEYYIKRRKKEAQERQDLKPAQDS